MDLDDRKIRHIKGTDIYNISRDQSKNLELEDLIVLS